MSIDELIAPTEVMEQQTVPQPNYHLDEAELEAAKQELYGRIEETQGDKKDLFAVWIQPSDPLADIVRTEERAFFPEMEELIEDYEDLCVFLAVVDGRGDEKKLVHAFRFSGQRKDTKEVDDNGDAVTGMPFIDDIIQSGQGLTTEDFVSFYEAQGTDLSKCISVETNFKIEAVDEYNGVPVSQIGYLALFNLVDSTSPNLGENEAAIFAHLNIPAIKSLSAAGVEYEDLAGVPGLRTPTVGETKFDDKYQPVAIPSTVGNVEVFRVLATIGAPEISI